MTASRYHAPSAGPQHGAPKVIAYDLEFARPIPLTAGGYDDWSRMTECGISVMVSWSNTETEPRVWVPEDDPNALRDFAVHALEHDVALTWNGIDCDDKMIAAELPVWEEALQFLHRLDLNIVAGLYALARHKGIDPAGIEAALCSGVPHDFPSLIGYKPGARQNVRNGWSLEKTYRATFDVTEAKSIAGDQAPLLWRDGRRWPVVGYCAGDAYRLLNLYGHAWDGEPLKNLKGREAHIPRSSLGGA